MKSERRLLSFKKVYTTLGIGAERFKRDYLQKGVFLVVVEPNGRQSIDKKDLDEYIDNNKKRMRNTK